MTTWRCAIHNVVFGAEGVDSGEVDCPKCSREKLSKLKSENEELRQHRSILLNAIEIKNLVSVT